MTPIPAGSPLILALYVAGQAPNSRRALANLAAIVREFLPDQQVEIIDVVEAPLRALEEGVLVTPTLIRRSPLPQLQVYGDLSATLQVLLALGIEQAPK